MSTDLPPHTVSHVDAQTLLLLKNLSASYPSIAAAQGKIALLKASLTFPKGSIHVISDIHGESKKLRHVINNASGALRVLVDQTLGTTLSEAGKVELLNFIYYPRESYSILKDRHHSASDLYEHAAKLLLLQFEILLALSKYRQIEELEAHFPKDYAAIFRELLFSSVLHRNSDYKAKLLEPLLEPRSALSSLRATARVIRNLLISELIIAGDLGDRGPRIDQVVEIIMRQPKVSITWGNHDATWLAACLGHDACIANVLRISLRYRRLSQLEEGYGIPMAPLERLAREIYAEDPAERFVCKGDGLRDAAQMSRMQKAISILQFKLEGQVIDRNPQFKLESRKLLHRIDPKKGSISLDNKEYPLRDCFFPTIDFSDPYALSPEEEACISRLRQSFLTSQLLWKHMSFVARVGSMYLTRDNHLIFHACVPVDNDGNYLSMSIDGQDYSGKPLFDKLDSIVHRCFKDPQARDLDLLWYLWTGPHSPWFGKDRMTTFESYFIEAAETHKETKNPYFNLIHETSFCEKILSEFGADSKEGLIVNGHVPVKIEAGESPLKKSGKAVTIDGAFSEAYGDKGYTLVLDSHRSYLALHHHFGSVDDAITLGEDIIPTIQDIRVFPQARLIGDTEQGRSINQEIALLELLISAYRENLLAET